jgi:hypothetical protein
MDKKSSICSPFASLRDFEAMRRKITAAKERAWEVLYQRFWTSESTEKAKSTESTESTS